MLCVCVYSDSILTFWIIQHVTCILGPSKARRTGADVMASHGVSVVPCVCMLVCSGTFQSLKGRMRCCMGSFQLQACAVAPPGLVCETAPLIYISISACVHSRRVADRPRRLQQAWRRLKGCCGADGGGRGAQSDSAGDVHSHPWRRLVQKRRGDQGIRGCRATARAARNRNRHSARQRVLSLIHI